ncbi:unnamed protein product [Miscanthus lutarioriparius]|uniref:Uncharacterized protein n=1 Tax=Miscanthus lutarioriparius TaxID=422564 RepID=A0A811QEG9_9POAL|nr:unnamed protein product [Miscanthus lutarioriparius]
MACSKKTLAIVVVQLLMALLASAMPASEGSRALLGVERCSKFDNCKQQFCQATCIILGLNAVGISKVVGTDSIATEATNIASEIVWVLETVI